jgi:hypothetical protein
MAGLATSRAIVGVVPGGLTCGGSSSGSASTTTPTHGVWLSSGWDRIRLPLAAAGAVTDWRARQTGARTQLATIAVALSVLATVALVAVIIGDAVAN